MKLRIKSVQDFKNHLKSHRNKGLLYDKQLNELLDVLIIAKENSPSKFLHSVNTSFTVLSLGLDFISIKASLFHHASPEFVESLNDSELKSIVQEIQMLNQIKKKNLGKIKSEDLSGILIYSSKDLRALIIFISSVLDDLRSLNPKEKEQAVLIHETFNPLVQKLGLTAIAWEFDDIPFKIVEPKKYYKIKDLMKYSRNQREKMSSRLEQKVKEIIGKHAINAKVDSRVKSFGSINRKMSKGKKFDELGDLIAARIICNSIEECYIILGLINAYFKTTEHYHDFIEKPKSSGYQSLHLTVNQGKMKAEIQIRTWKMHFNAELGSAAHWKYKQINENKLADEKISLIRQLIEIQKRAGKEFIDTINIDLSKGKVFVFTPKKEIIVLPSNATVLDFAFALHTDLGFGFQKAFVNNKAKTLDYKLNNFDKVRIVAGKKPEAKVSWMSSIVTQKARLRLRQFFGLKKTPDSDKKSSGIEKSSLFQALCCKPLPEDETVAVKTTKRKLIMHKADCLNLSKISGKKIIQMSKEVLFNLKAPFTTNIQIRAVDYPGILIEILEIVSKQNVKILKAEAEAKGNLFEGTLEIELNNTSELKKVINAIKRELQVISVSRA